MSWRIQKHCGEELEQFGLVIVGLERVSGRYVLYKVSIATFAIASAGYIKGPNTVDGLFVGSAISESLARATV
jgi:hypothetical protein